MKTKGKIAVMLAATAVFVTAAVLTVLFLVKTQDGPPAVKQNAEPEYLAGFKPLTPQLGARPADITPALVKSQILFDYNCVRLSDGYVEYKDGNLVKYDLRGNVVWTKKNAYTYSQSEKQAIDKQAAEYEDDPGFDTFRTVIAADGGFYCTQANASNWVNSIDKTAATPYTLERYDNGGTLLWRYVFTKKDIYREDNIYSLSDGNTLFVGECETDSGLYVAKLNEKGELIAEKSNTYISIVFILPYGPVYAGGKGFVTAYATDTGSVLTFYKDDLTLIKGVPNPYALSDLVYANGQLYGFDDTDGTLLRIDWDGTITKLEALNNADAEYHWQFSNISSPFNGPVITNNTQIFFYDEKGRRKLTLDDKNVPFIDPKVAMMGKNILVFYERPVGYLPTTAGTEKNPEAVACEQIYCLYDTNGKLLWRGAYPLYTQAEQAKLTGDPDHMPIGS